MSSSCFGLELPPYVLLADEDTDLLFHLMTQYVLKLTTTTITMRLPKLTPKISSKNEAVTDNDNWVSKTIHEIDKLIAIT